MNLFQQAFQVTESVLKIYQSWILQEITPLKVTFLFNYLYVQLIMIDINGDVRRYKITYKYQGWHKSLWHILRLAYLLWNDVIHAREMKYERLYAQHIAWSRKRQSV